MLLHPFRSRWQHLIDNDIYKSISAPIVLWRDSVSRQIGHHQFDGVLFVQLAHRFQLFQLSYNFV